MVVFNLECSAGHGFEGWFDDLKDLKSQLKRGLLTCPVCGDVQVRQVPAGFAIAKKKPGDDGESEQVGRLLQQAMHRYFVENFEDTGTGFAKEALKIHYGVSEARNIRGVSTPREEEMLKQEGVEFFKVGQPADQDGEDFEDD